MMDSWYPDRSISVQDDYQECGRRSCEQAPEIIRKSNKIVRRKYPTVDPRIREAISEPAEEQEPETPDPFSNNTASRQTEHTPIGGFCRWQERENLSIYASAPKQDNFSVHYREVSVRGGRQLGAKGCQRFQHLSDAKAYAEAYRPFSYTSICAGNVQQQHPERSTAEVQKEPELEKCVPVIPAAGSAAEAQPAMSKEKQLNDRERRTRSYLHELAVRLGVREALRDRYFTAPILPSPPSISRNRQIDFILYAHGTKADSNASNGSTTATDADEDSEEQIYGSSDSKLCSSELPPIVPKLTHGGTGDTPPRENSDPRLAEQLQLPMDAPGTPRKGESSKEMMLLRTAQSLGLVSRKWSSRKHDRPSEALDQSAYVNVGKGPSCNANKLSLDDDSARHAPRHNSSGGITRTPAIGDFVSQEKRGNADSAPQDRKPHSASQFTSVMRPQKLSRARRKLTTALGNVSMGQDKPPPQISGILGIQRHRLIPP